MSNQPLKLIYVLLCAFCLAAPDALAGIIASATRVVFNEGDTEKTLMLFNTNNYPVIVQTWVDNGDVNTTPECSLAPFISLPVIFGMKPATLKGLKIIATNKDLPADRESVFWLNLYEIPPSKLVKPPSQQRITLAMNSQMKIFGRPKTVTGKAILAPDSASFTMVKSGDGYRLICTNSSAFYLSFAHLSVQLKAKVYPVRQESDMMTPPFSSKTYYIDRLSESEPL